MKALCWHGTNDIRCDNVPDPKIEDGRDVIIKVTSCAICGSDLHLMDGLMPTMKSGDILGHEFMGEVVETGSAHDQVQEGRSDRRSLQHQLRRVPPVQTRQLFGLPAIQSQRGDGGRAVRLHDGRLVWLLPPYRAATQAARPNMCACRWPMSRP